MKYVLFFRGINVGGNKIVNMQLLSEALVSIGMKNVKTFLQSGNVYVESEERPSQLQLAITNSFEEKFGFSSDVIIRTVEEVNSAVKKNMYKGDPSHVLLLFLSATPTKEAIQDLKIQYIGSEEFSFIGDCIYIHYIDGVGRSKLTLEYIEKNLGVRATGRNINTLAKILSYAQHT